MKLKLYYGAGSCSMSCKIAIDEAKLAHEAVLVDFEAPGALTAEVAALNPLGALPIMTSDGKTMTQNIAILEYIADNAPGSNLLPAVGTWERAEVMRWLSFTASDLHKSFSPLFGMNSIATSPGAKTDLRNWAVSSIDELFTIAEKQLTGRDYLTGKNFTIADAYFFVVTGWTKWVDISIAKYPNLSAFQTRVAHRPVVAKILKDNGMA